jgi:transmembrane protein
MRVLGRVAMNTSPTKTKRNETPRVVIRLLDNPTTLLIARIMVTAPFIVGGLTKMFDWSAGIAEMTHVGLRPAAVFNFAVLFTQLAGSALVIANRWVWLGAGALGIFTVWATLLAHRFWELTGPERMMQMNSFFEHWTISAAFVLVAVVGLRKPAEPS